MYRVGRTHQGGDLFVLEANLFLEFQQFDLEILAPLPQLFAISPGFRGIEIALILLFKLDIGHDLSAFIDGRGAILARIPVS